MGSVNADRKKREKKIEKKYLKKRQSILEGALTPTSKDKALRKLEKKKDKKLQKILSGEYDHSEKKVWYDDLISCIELISALGKQTQTTEEITQRRKQQKA